ncbi:beta-galactosidase GalA [Sphingomonas endophytica]|uniref:Beta-galactosidase n=1 Tax=Sphingomonas endophytica TaxID=869719 RepID=A0A147HYH2_9SPHN|nr:beta-galactosidase GalA [Sphingomonas endophytica]KTT69951.1 beta-galactosidase [Sphingomonas endophytica]
MTVTRRALLASGIAVPALPPFAMAAPAVPYLDSGDAPAPFDIVPEPPFVADPSLLRLDTGWLFHKGDIVVPQPMGHEDTYHAAKAGVAPGAAGVAWDDSDWREVVLPHDWAMEEPVDPTANVAQGYRKRGIGWYRRTLQLPPEWRGKYLEIQLGAAATNATVWFNGINVAHSYSGYTAILIDITPYARFGEELNTLSVRVDADTMEGWWYEGAGLYRHNWLAVRDPVAIVTDGLHADPRRVDGRWTVPVALTVANNARQAATVQAEAVLFDAAGREIGRATGAVTIDPLDRGEARMTIAVADPKLWSVETPTLYRVEARLLRDGKAIDTRATRIGFRDLRFDAGTGFYLNGQHVKLKGVCVHQDHAGVGVAMPDALWDWRARRLKAMGCNAIRCSHHAPAPEMLDACDRLGILVMDENRNFNPSPDFLAQLEWLVRRDRNRPSVIMWSVFNEEPMQATEQGFEMVRRMAHVVKELDDSRPVTAAMNDGMFTPLNVSQAVDVVGINYQHRSYDPFHAAHPAKPMTSSEDTSAFMTRGVWKTDLAKHEMSSYDTEAADWGLTHHQSWKEIDTRAFVGGTFVWTGFDYHGEPTPFEWPTTSSLFGIMDLCGFAKMAFHLRRAQWEDAAPALAIAPHWTWPGREGQPIRVMVLSNADTVELSLNGKSLGKQKVDRLAMPEWQVPYQSGRLEAVAWRGGREIARTSVETVGAPVALQLIADRRTMLGTGTDVQPFTVAAVDARGRVVPGADARVTFAVTGGAVIGVGNGDPNDHDSEVEPVRRLFSGLAQALVRADAGAGTVTLTASAPGLKSARVMARVVKAEPLPALPPTRPVAQLTDWKRSEFVATRPDPLRVYAKNDMNSLLGARPGRLEQSRDAAAVWSTYRTTFVPRRRVAEQGGVVAFAEVVGRAEAWIDGERRAVKSDPAAGPLLVPFPKGAGEHALVLLVQAEPGQPSGLGKVVAVRER